ARADVEQPLPQRAEPARTLVEGRAVAADPPLHARRPMVAQVLSDARQVVAHLDAEALEALGLADARQLQELRRGDGAGAHDHLARGTRLALPAADGIAHAHAAAAVENEALGQRVRLDREVRARAGGIEVASRRAHAPALVDRGLRHGDAFLIPAVVVAVGLDPDGLGGLEEAVVEPPALVDVRDLQRAFAAADLAVAACVGLHALEDRQHVLVAPAAVAELGPMIVILPLAAHPHHAVDGARAAEHAPARHGDCPASGLRIGL